jgi:hypothetical protein
MRKIPSPFGLKSPFGSDERWLTNPVWDIVSDPPEASFNSRRSGTLAWDFHSLPTAPALGAGDIATGTGGAIVAGQNDLTVDLSAYPAETGYLYIWVTDGPLVSNFIRSPQFTTAGSGSVVDEGASTGGAFSTIVDGVDYRVAKYAASGSLVVTSTVTVEYEIIAAGASGGYGRGGGGGAGKRKTGSVSLTPGTYTVTVGLGGPARGSLGSGTNGDNSTFNGVTANGGGFGGGATGSIATAGGDGGHGGGAAAGDAGGTAVAGVSNDGGNSGGLRFNSSTTNNRAGGGGGGEGGAGGAASTAMGGTAGAGISTSIDGIPITVCAGGVGYGTTMPGNPTGAGNPGSGGNGSHSGASGAGQNGRIVIRWAI